MSGNNSVLDAELLALLAKQQVPVVPEPPTAARLKSRILKRARKIHELESHQEGRESRGGFLTLRAGEGEWVSLTPKVALMLLREDAVSRTFLLRLDPGAVLPPHDHPLDEECYVLEGELRFGGLVVRAGDYHLAPKGSPHGEVLSHTGALLLLRGANP